MPLPADLQSSGAVAEKCREPQGRGTEDLTQRVARFRQVNMDDPHVHHDALEFADGQIVMVTRLVPGQTATVLQLPARSAEHGGHRHASDSPASAPVA